MPPVAVVRAACVPSDGVLHTLIAHPRSHPWRAAGPLSVPQCAALMGHAMHPQAMDAARAVVTATQLRSILFQGVHGLSTAVIARQVEIMRGERGWGDLHTFASTGAGLDMMGAQLMAAGRVHECVWYVEGNPVVRRAHDAYWTALGQHPRGYRRADDWELQRMMPRADVELITLRCAPFSPKHRRFPRGCWAALRELRVVLAGVKRRCPRVVIYENTAGLWRRQARAWRRRVERLLRGLRRYRWGAVHTSPHRHSGCSVRRERIFYLGVC